MVKYAQRIDILILNWIEDLPDKQGGIIQSIFFVLQVFFLKVRKKKILWVMHNKLTHHPRNLRLKKWLFRFMLRKADVILTHAREGISFARKLTGNDKLNIHFFPHPTIPAIYNVPAEKETDILIWGAVSPYKAVDKFLKFLLDNHLENKYKIRITGKITPAEYRDKVLQYQQGNICIQDAFVEKAELEEIIRKSKIVLFTYAGDSILSSGALIDTLCLGARILGPDMGNFRDLAEAGMIDTYKDYHELPEKIEILLSEKDQFLDAAALKYFEETSWERFAMLINQLI
jgi:hypothetical protein